jgi:hypothetical protein
MTAEEKRRMLAAIFDMVVAPRSRRRPLPSAARPSTSIRVRDGGLDLLCHAT